MNNYKMIVTLFSFAICFFSSLVIADIKLIQEKNEGYNLKSATYYYSEPSSGNSFNDALKAISNVKKMVNEVLINPLLFNDTVYNGNSSRQINRKVNAYAIKDVKILATKHFYKDNQNWIDYKIKVFIDTSLKSEAERALRKKMRQELLDDAWELWKVEQKRDAGLSYKEEQSNLFSIEKKDLVDKFINGVGEASVLKKYPFGKRFKLPKKTTSVYVIFRDPAKMAELSVRLSPYFKIKQVSDEEGYMLIPKKISKKQLSKFLIAVNKKVSVLKSFYFIRPTRKIDTMLANSTFFGYPSQGKEIVIQSYLYSPEGKIDEKKGTIFIPDGVFMLANPDTDPFDFKYEQTLRNAITSKHTEIGFYSPIKIDFEHYTNPLIITNPYTMYKFSQNFKRNGYQ